MMLLQKENNVVTHSFGTFFVMWFILFIYLFYYYYFLISFMYERRSLCVLADTILNIYKYIQCPPKALAS